MSQGHHRNQSHRFSIAMSALILATPVVAVGGVHPEVQCALLVLYSILFGVVFVRDRVKRRPFLWHPILVISAGFAIAAWLQTIPIPISWLQTLSPNLAASLSAIDRIFGIETHFAPITLDRTATLAAAARWWLVTLGLATLFQGFRSRTVRRSIPALILLLSAFVVLVGTLQWLLGLERIYGFFTPLHRLAVVGFAGPFVGSNHAGQFLLIGSMVCLALLIDHPHSRYRVLITVLFAVLVGGILANGSRGALLAVGLSILGLFVVRIRRGWRSLNTVILSSGMALALLSLVSLEVPEIRSFFDLDAFRAQLDWSKLGMQGIGWSVIQEFPWTGVGADAFASVQVALAHLKQQHVLTHIENDFLHILADFGFLVAAGVVLAGLGVWWWVRLRVNRRPSRTAWWFVIFAYALYSTVNFTLAVPALVLALGGIFASRLAHLNRITVKLSGKVVIPGAVLMATVLCLVSHPLLHSPGDTTTLVGLHRQALEQPMNGRHLWLTTCSGLDVMAAESIERAAERSLDLAGNDTGLLEALGQYWMLDGQPMKAWEVFDRAVGYYPYFTRKLPEWLDPLDDPAIISDVCTAFPHHQQAIFERLRITDRNATLLQVVLGLDDSPMVEYYRILASQNLNEPILVRGFAQRLPRYANPGDPQCMFLARGRRLAGEVRESLETMKNCVEAAPDDLFLAYLYLNWLLASRDEAEAHRVEVAAMLERLDLLTIGDIAARRRYYQMLAMVQARDGLCRAAGLSLETTRQADGRIAAVPGWVRAACPGLPESISGQTAQP